MRPDQCRSVQVVGCNTGSEALPEGPPNRIRVVQLKRRGNAPLGFSIRGGREHGTGVFVSHVAQSSEAHHRGLKVGDQIVRINGYPVDYFVHEEVLALLKARSSIVLKVKSVGMIPIKNNKRDPITWQFVEAEQCSSGSDGTAHSVSSASSLDEPVETKVFISGVGSSTLGCSVVKGPPELPGIFVQTVKPHGLAEMAGLEVADQVTEVNGRTLDNLEFAEAIAMLKSFKEMALTVKKGAGMELFPEEQRRRRLARGLGECHLHPHFNGNDVGHNQDGLAHSIGGSAGSWSHGTVTNGSSGTHSMEGSLSSFQSTSPVANGHAQHCLELSNKYRATENGASHHQCGGHSNSETEERRRLEEEKRRLQEKEEQLRLEAEKLASERRRLQLEASAVQPILQPVLQPPPPPCNVFAELHSVAEKKRLSRENSAQQNGDRSHNGPKGDPPSSRDVLIKQKQHEQLMVEFREVHQKMFGSNGTASSEQVTRTAPAQCHLTTAKKASAANQGALEGRRPQRQGYSTNQLPTPPSSAQPQLMAAKESMPTTLESAKLDEVANHTDSIVESGAAMCKKLWPVYIPPAHPNPHMFIQPTNSQNLPKVVAQPPVVQEKSSKVGKPSKGPAPPPPVTSKDVSPITDSRGPELKPPRTFFSEKPLVTIGTYPDPSNPRPNRFVPRLPKVELVESESRCSTLERSTASLKASSEKASLAMGPKMTVSINTKPPNHPSLSTRFSTTSGANQVPMNSVNNVSNNNDDSDTGAVIKTLTFKKDGVLNLNVEGGLNSIHDGRIVVSEIREGGLVPLDGDIQKGDQLLMVNNVRLVNVSLTAARVALQNAMGNDGNELRLTIAKLPH